jgi:Alginate export
MKSTLTTLSAGALVLAAIEQVHAQYAPPPPPTPFQGFINEYLRAQDPYMNQWDFGGNERLRYEKKDHLAIQGNAGSVDFRDHGADEYNDYFLSRLRFHVGYTDKWWSAYVEPQSSLVVSDERFAYANAPAVAGTVKRKENGPEADAIDLHQAYFTIGNHKEFPLSLKAGRQELSYGEERLVGAFAWNNIGRSFDAAKIRWQNPFFGVDFFSGYPVIPENGKFDVGNMPHDWFSGIYATSMKIPTTILDVYFLSRNADRHAINAQPSPQFPQPTARDIYTIGGRLKSKPGELGNFDYSLEGAYQFGDFAASATAKRLRQSAFMYCAQAGYTFSDLWSTPRLGVEYDYSSGDNNSADGVHHTFDNLFPTNHKFYGSMDVTSLQNIQDVGVNLSLKPTPRMSVALMGNVFWLANDNDFFYNVAGAPRTTAGYGIHPNDGNFVGSEVTVVTGYALTRFAQIEAGYGHFFTGSYIDRSLVGVGGDHGADWLYTQLSVNF